MTNNNLDKGGNNCVAAADERARENRKQAVERPVHLETIRLPGTGSMASA